MVTLKKVSTDTANAEFYFTLSKYNTVAEEETLLSTSGTTPVIESLSYEQFFETALLNNGAFVSTDLIVIKFYANKVGVLSDPIYAFQFGGANPVRTLLPVPVSVLPLDNKVNKTGDTMTGDLTIEGDLSIGDSTPKLLSTNLAEDQLQTNATWTHFGNINIVTPADAYLATYSDTAGILFSADWKLQDASFNNVVEFDYDAGVLSYNSVEVATLDSYVAGVVETNNDTNISFWKGTQAEYDAIVTKDSNTIYYIIGA